jgi:hypothetical protein
MTTTPTHWIAGTLGITPVVILETGTGGQDLAFVPPDPVVVRSVTDYFEFVASEGSLFTDKDLAMKESGRLHEEEVHQAKVLLARIERQEIKQTKVLLARAEQESKYIDSLPNDQEIIENKSLGSTHPVVNLDLALSELEILIPVENVVAKKITPEETTKPKSLLECILYVVGRETISFDDICKRLEAREWFPKRRSSVSNVLSAHKNLFHCPEKGMYALRSKPKVSPVESDGVVVAAVETVSVPSEVSAETGVVEPLEVESDDDSEEVTEHLESATLPETDPELVPEPEPEPVPESKVEKKSVFDTWFGKPMVHLSPTRSHYHDENQETIFTEKFSSLGFWTAEIHIEGLDTWASGTSNDRLEARAQARTNLNIKVKTVNDILDRNPGVLDPKYFK